MSAGHHADDLTAKAAEAIRGILTEAEERAAEIVRDAEAKAASIREQAGAEASQIRERAEGDARAQIEAAKRSLDELGGTLAAAASSALPKVDAASKASEREEETGPGPHPDPKLEPDEPQEETEEPAGPPEAPVSPPSEESSKAARAPAGNGDAAERLIAMKLAVEAKDAAAIDTELTEKFGHADRSALLDDVLSRATR